jgi:hypothetical protein
MKIIIPEQKTLLPFIPGTFSIINPGNAEKKTAVIESIRQNKLLRNVKKRQVFFNTVQKSKVQPGTG